MAEVIKSGKIDKISKFGGILFEGEDKWYNAEKILASKLEIPKLKDALGGKRVSLSLDDKGNWIGISVHVDDDEEVQNPEEDVNYGEETVSGTPANEDKKTIGTMFITMQGKTFVTFAGLLNEAHKKGLVSIETFMVSPPGSEQVIFKAIAICRDKDTKELKKFEAHGDADATNVNKMIAVHKIRMAETRSICRALRLLTNIGMTSIEELSEVKEEEK